MAYNNQTTPLIQSVFKGSDELDISFLREASYVETLDLSGPRLILRFDDRLSIVRNILKVKTGDTLSVKIEDVIHADTLKVSTDFQIMSMPVDGDIVTLNCLQKSIAALKVPAVKAILFTKSKYSISKIIEKFCVGLSVEMPEAFNLLCDYHLLPGERPSLVLRQMAMEHGAVIYYNRGKIHFKTVKTMYNAADKSEICLDYQNPGSLYPIVSYTHINKEDLVKDRVYRKLFGFHLNDGFINGDAYSSSPPEFSGLDNKYAMDGLAKIEVPMLDLIASGNGAFTPGLPVKFRWGLDAKYNDSFLDESLPDKAVMGNVAHYSAGAQNYFCRIKAVVPL